MVALVLADALLEKFGGDSVTETRRNVESYLGLHGEDLPIGQRGQPGRSELPLPARRQPLPPLAEGRRLAQIEDAAVLDRLARPDVDGFAVDLG